MIGDRWSKLEIAGAAGIWLRRILDGCRKAPRGYDGSVERLDLVTRSPTSSVRWPTATRRPSRGSWPRTHDDMVRVNSFVVCGDADLAEEAVAAAWASLPCASLVHLRPARSAASMARVDRRQRGAPGGPSSPKRRRRRVGDARPRGRLGSIRLRVAPTSTSSTPSPASTEIIGACSPCATSPVRSTHRNWPAPTWVAQRPGPAPDSLAGLLGRLLNGAP